MESNDILIGMCILCDYTSSAVKNFDHSHIEERIKDFSTLQLKAILKTIPGLKKESIEISNTLFIPEKKRSLDSLINHLDYMSEIIIKNL